MEIQNGLSEFSVPLVLIGAVMLIALASLALHFLFPPASGKCPMKEVLPDNPLEPETKQREG